LLTATRNPLVILLIVLAIISFATGDAGTVMSLMVILGVSLRCVQEARDDHPDHGGGARWQA
jgi:Mg2+-importing ATPase